jgi:catechol 2,3-dioxygenase-like lactoylglutathione lyase family enzyme
MSVMLDHTIVHVRDAVSSADFLVRMLDLPPWTRLGHFTVVHVGGTSLDLVETEGEIASRHFAFRVPEAAFPAIVDRRYAEHRPFWADPFHRHFGQINTWDDGLGVYFGDPNGHLLEVLTRSYTSVGLRPAEPAAALRSRHG